MKTTHVVEQRRKRAVPKGGLLPSARTQLAAAEARFEPGNRKHQELLAERDRILARLVELDDPVTVQELREQEDLQLQRKAIIRQIEMHLGPGSPHAQAAAERATVAREAAMAEGDLYRARSQIADLTARIAPLLHDCYGLTGDVGELSLVIEVKP